MMDSAGSFVGPCCIGVNSDAFCSYPPTMLMLAACLLGASAMQLSFRVPGMHWLQMMGSASSMQMVIRDRIASAYATPGHICPD